MTNRRVGWHFHAENMVNKRIKNYTRKKSTIIVLRKFWERKKSMDAQMDSNFYEEKEMGKRGEQH